MSTADHRRLTRDELAAEAILRFGPDPKRWAFKCPSCGDVATAEDFCRAGAGLTFGMTGQECIGRYTKDRGCTWVAYGLIQGPWEIVIPAADGRPEQSIRAFPLADAPVPDCCICDPAECVADKSGQHCADRSCGRCLHGCPAPDESQCCQAAKRAVIA